MDTFVIKYKNYINKKSYKLAKKVKMNIGYKLLLFTEAKTIKKLYKLI